jgi:endonuclease G, mitochondrial
MKTVFVLYAICRAIIVKSAIASVAIVCVLGANPTNALSKMAIKAATGLAIGASAYARETVAKLPGTSQTSPHSPAAHGPPTCSTQLPKGRAPTFTNPKLAQGLHTLCFEEFAVAVSEKTKTPMWVSEYLTRQRISQARTMQRQNSFHEEQALPSQARAYLKDYVRSGYDRGHMAPSGDMSTPTAQHESFSLSNMIPQDPNNNRRLWEGIESGTRNYAVYTGSVYVVTGPLFMGNNVNFLNGRVGVPTHLFKLLYDPVRAAGGVFFVENIDTKKIDWLSIPEFEKMSGYQFGLSSPALMPMPKPEQHF